jgi:deoxyribose-phosphate aldolase
MLQVKDIAKMIDHSLLNPKFTDEEIKSGCELAKEYNVATVCVRPTDLKLAAEILKDSDVLPTTVIGFPHGSNRTDVKVFEAKQAIADGALELDMVLNIGKLLSGEFDYVRQDIKAVCDLAHSHNIPVKVIFENCYLSDELKIKACKLCDEAGADFVKTSTGYGTGGATVEDLKLMRANTKPETRIKAAGGVRTLNGALAVRKLGGARFGATATKAILEDAKQRYAKGELKELSDSDEIIIGGSY